MTKTPPLPVSRRFFIGYLAFAGAVATAVQLWWAR